MLKALTRPPQSPALLDATHGARRANTRKRLANPDISPTPVEARTALPFECPFIEVSNLDERAGNAEAKLYRRS
jgi:hypothetical protein